MLFLALKGKVHSKMTSWFTHSQAILSVYDFLFSDEYNQSYIKFLALPSFIMAVNGENLFKILKRNKVHPSIIKKKLFGFVYSKGKPVSSWLKSKSSDNFLFKPLFCISNSLCFILLSPLWFCFRHCIRQHPASSAGTPLSWEIMVY